MDFENVVRGVETQDCRTSQLPMRATTKPPPSRARGSSELGVPPGGPSSGGQARGKLGLAAVDGNWPCPKQRTTTWCKSPLRKSTAECSGRSGRDYAYRPAHHDRQPGRDAVCGEARGELGQPAVSACPACSHPWGGRACSIEACGGALASQRAV